MQDKIDELRTRPTEITQLLAVVRATPQGSRFFTTDPAAGVHLGGGRVRAPRAMPGPRGS